MDLDPRNVKGSETPPLAAHGMNIIGLIRGKLSSRVEAGCVKSLELSHPAAQAGHELCVHRWPTLRWMGLSP